MPNALGTNAIGPTFGGELLLAYPELSGRPFTWASDGSFFYDPSITQTEINKIQTVYHAHDPVKSSLLDYSENVRYNTEVGGITVNGTFTQTDLQSQAALHAVYTYCQIHTGITIQWKLPDFTFIPYTAAQVIHVFDMVNTFVQNCFNEEATVNGQIKSGAITSNGQIDNAYRTIPTSY